tara:strand:+ start:2782 stop:3216 length:435 start_codon:yes stop_codon:yes gene_type:complete
MPDVVDKVSLETILRNIFKGGTVNGATMDRLPKNRRSAEAFLALAAASLDSQAELSEAELNQQLMGWMEGFTNPTLFDHVTVRRYLVDLSMLLRDAEGRSYRTNQPVIGSYISMEARTVQPMAILEEVRLTRMNRRQKAGAQNT